MRIYISGKITGTKDYMKKFSKAEKKLKKLYPNAEIINPAKVNATLPKTFTWGDYMKVSICLLELADTIYLLEDWEDSTGAKKEYEFAVNHGYNVSLKKF